MNLLERIRSWWPSPELVRAAADYRANVIPPYAVPGPRTWLSLPDAVTLPAVYRALQVLTTSVSQLPLDVERRGQRVDTPPALIRRPNVDMSRSDFLESLVMSLATDGNAFILKDRAGTSSVINLKPLNPREVTVYTDPRKGIRYGYDGKEYGPDTIEHLHFIRVPGQVRGIGPIQAAQTTIRGAADMSAYMGQWFDTSGQPAGVLTSDQPLTGADALTARNRWNGLDDNGDALDQTMNPSRIKVLGKGMAYQPIILNPKDAMWLESQAFSTLEIARIFGLPASLLLTSADGDSMTYQNIEQEWIAFSRFTLMQYLRKIEEALTNCTPNGQTVRFRIEALLRADTKTRYEAHEIAIRSGFLTPDEVRDIEGLAPLTPAQRAELKDKPTTQGIHA